MYRGGRKIRAYLALSGILAVMLPALPASALTAKDFTITGDSAVLQGLDKVTARISTMEVALGEEIVFGSLKVVVRTCRKTPPTEIPESTAFLEINDDRIDAASERIFTGWMFASSPALNALEHPVYDVWLLDCKKSSSAEGGSSTGN